MTADRTHLNASEVAAALRLHIRTVHRLAATGDLPAYRFGRALRFDPVEVENWRQSRRIAPCPVTSTGVGRDGGSEPPSPAVSIDSAYARLIGGRRSAGQPSRSSA